MESTRYIQEEEEEEEKEEEEEEEEEEEGVQPPRAARIGNTPHLRERRGRVRRRLRSRHGQMALQPTVRLPATSDHAPRHW